MQEEEEVPLCATCGHHHVPGVKCTVCGHVGKSNIFKKMKERAAAYYKLDLCYYGTGLENGCDFSQNQNIEAWAVIRELRGNVCRAAGGNLTHEFNIQQEKNSRHMLGYYGSRPFLCARYSLHVANSNSNSNPNPDSSCSSGNGGNGGYCLLDRFWCSIGVEQHKTEFEHCVRCLHVDTQQMFANMQLQQYVPQMAPQGPAALIVYIPQQQQALGTALCAIGYEAATFSGGGEAGAVEHEGISFIGLRFTGSV